MFSKALYELLENNSHVDTHNAQPSDKLKAANDIRTQIKN